MVVSLITFSSVLTIALATSLVASPVQLLSTVGAQQQTVHGVSGVTVRDAISPDPKSDATDVSDKDIVSNVVKAVQITTQENIFINNLFGVVSKISNLSLESTKAAVNIQVLNAYVDLIVKSLDFIRQHRLSGEKYAVLIAQVLAEATQIMTESPKGQG
jgi:hypothetical protein